jgi:hypothetical protein
VDENHRGLMNGKEARVLSQHSPRGTDRYHKKPRTGCLLNPVPLKSWIGTLSLEEVNLGMGPCAFISLRNLYVKPDKVSW